MLANSGISYFKYCVDIQQLLASELNFKQEFDKISKIQLNDFYYYRIFKSKN